MLNIEIYYTEKAEEMLAKLKFRGKIFVMRYKPDECPKFFRECGLACSIGLGGFGIIFLNETVYNFPEDLRLFIIAHEISHIVRSHIIVNVFTRVFAKMMAETLKESIKSTIESKDFSDFLLNLLSTLFVAIMARGVINIDAETVRHQELEADKDAVVLVGCKSARIFSNLLNKLKEMGYNVSHEAILGVPALTIEERIRKIEEMCP